MIYAALYGIFTSDHCMLLGFRAGFSFSAGAMDLFFSCLPSCSSTEYWLIIPLGIAAFVVFYVRIPSSLSQKWDLKTPGREDDDVEAEKKDRAWQASDYTAVAATILRRLLAVQAQHYKH